MTHIIIQLKAHRFANLSVFVPLFQSMSSHDVFISGVVHSNLFVEVSSLQPMDFTNSSYLQVIFSAIHMLLPVSHTVRTFHVPILMVAVVFRSDIGLVAFEETRLSS